MVRELRCKETAPVMATAATVLAGTGVHSPTLLPGEDINDHIRGMVQAIMVVEEEVASRVAGVTSRVVAGMEALTDSLTAGDCRGSQGQALFHKGIWVIPMAHSSSL
jgi:hypothetical protein